MNFTLNTNAQLPLKKTKLDDFFPNQFQSPNLSPEKICDYRIERFFWFYKKLIVYVIDDRASIGKWRRVRKFESMTNTLAKGKRVNEIIEILRKQKEKFDSLGHREKSWFCQY